MTALSHCLAFFVTAHGFGHASRATAVAESLAQRLPQYEFQFFTTVPEQHIGASLATFSYQPFDCDVGLVQADALHADLPRTVQRLNAFLPFNPSDIQKLATFLQRRGCVAIISDIAPLGIEVARAAKLPSILIENFTWDWIYRAYSLRCPGIGQYADHLSSIFARADLHIQCRPRCYTSSGSILTSPVSRRFQKEREFVRNQLGVSSQEKMVFISMGGTPHSPLDVKSLGTRYRDIIFFVANSDPIQAPLSNVRHLPLDSPLFHPDLMRAADVVIGKAGYSTIAEVFHAGVPFGYFSRSGDPEMPSLLSFINETIQGIHFTDGERESNGWFEQLPALISMPRIDRSEEPNGADQCADEIIRFLRSQSA